MRSLESQSSWFARIQLTLAAVIVAAGASFYFVWYRPATGHMRDLRATLDTSHSKLELSRTKADNLPAVAKAVADLRRDLATFDRQVPQHQDYPQFIEQIESLKQSAGIAKWSFKPDLSQTYAGYSEQSIHVEFEGDFSTIADFLAKVEGMDRMTRIRHLQMKSAASAPGAVEVQMDVCIYYLES